MKVIDLLNRIANGEIEDKRTFNIRFGNGTYRSIYYDNEEKNCMCCLKNVSDDYSIYDDISFDTEIETIEKDKKIRKIKVDYSPDIEEEIFYEDGDKPLHYILGDAGTKLLINKINEIIDYINGGTNE
jgi:hypothetical protein